MLLYKWYAEIWMKNYIPVWLTSFLCSSPSLSPFLSSLWCCTPFLTAQSLCIATEMFCGVSIQFPPRSHRRSPSSHPSSHSCRSCTSHSLCRWVRRAYHTLCRHTHSNPQRPTNPEEIQSRYTGHSDTTLPEHTHTFTQTHTYTHNNNGRSSNQQNNYSYKNIRIDLWGQGTVLTIIVYCSPDPF